MPKKKSPLASLGDIWEGSNAYAARVRFRSADGQTQHIYGPQRAARKSAEADLASIRAYGPLFENDREGGFLGMRAEARRIKERVAFEREIKMAMQREAKEAEDGGPDDPEEDVEDADEWWRLLQDGGEQERYTPESILSQSYTPLQANRLMHAFMPTTGTAGRAWPSPLLQG